jgi:hypothetical protein
MENKSTEETFLFVWTWGAESGRLDLAWAQTMPVKTARDI